MPRIRAKPQFPQPSTAEMKASLEKLQTAIEGATTADGTVDLDAVEARVGGDAIAKEALDAIRSDDAFERVETRPSTGCGGGTQEVHVPATGLEGAEIQSVLGALLAAKTRIDTQDTNRDGVINKDEVATDSPDTLAGNIAEATVDTALEGYRAELHDWSSAVNGIKRDIEQRKTYDARIEDKAAFHAETPAGGAALAWAYRALLTKGATDPWDMDDALKRAETGFLRFLPFFNAGGEGHLSDAEVKKHLGTSNFAAFVDEKKAEIKVRVGGDYESHWLEGKDIEGSEHIDDPDLIARASAGC